MPSENKGEFDEKQSVVEEEEENEEGDDEEEDDFVISEDLKRNAGMRTNAPGVRGETHGPHDRKKSYMPSDFV